MYTYTNRLYAALTDQFSFRTAFVQNARGQFSTFIVVTYPPVKRHQILGNFKSYNCRR